MGLKPGSAAPKYPYLRGLCQHHLYIIQYIIIHNMYIYIHISIRPTPQIKLTNWMVATNELMQLAATRSQISPSPVTVHLD